jgi:hypothetical protein
MCQTSPAIVGLVQIDQTSSANVGQVGQTLECWHGLRIGHVWVTSDNPIGLLRAGTGWELDKSRFGRTSPGIVG